MLPNLAVPACEASRVGHTNVVGMTGVFVVVRIIGASPVDSKRAGIVGDGDVPAPTPAGLSGALSPLGEEGQTWLILP